MDIKEQYKQELINQEIKSNKRTIKGFIWFLLGVAFIWILTMTGFFKVDKELVTIASVSTFVLLIPPLYLFFRSDLSRPWLKYLFLSLMCIVSAVIISFLSFHATFLYVFPLLFAIQYRRRSTIWFVYVVNTITMLISSLVSFYYGICDLNLLIGYQNTRSWYMDIVTNNTLILPLNKNLVFIIIVFEVFPRSIILFVFTIMMQYTIVSSNEDAYKIAQLTYFKETDTKTQVFNKNKYEEMVTEYYPKIEKIDVVFWDLNNLKYINDRYGHAMGDKAIDRLSTTLHRFSNNSCRVYRIGGDEFLMIIDNPIKGETEKMITVIVEDIGKDKVDDKIFISSAVGYASGKGRDILEIVKMADERMYENKRICKENKK